MPRQHRVREGECLASIAFQNGFAVDTVWNDPANAALKALRTTPFLLVPGDVVTVPDRRPGEEERATGARHEFRRRDVPERLRLRFLDEAGEPRGGVPFVLEIDGERVEGATDGDGWIDHPISPSARDGRLVLDGRERYDLDLGSLRPAGDEPGARARLVALGHLSDVRADARAYADALRGFQAEQEFPATGTLDDATRARLEEAYGC
jgi:hypothetical protein